MSKITILSKEQIYGDNCLKYFKKKDKISGLTDFSIINGAYIPDYEVYYTSLTNPRGGLYCLKDYNGNTVAAINNKGKKDHNYPGFRSFANRLITVFDEEKHSIIGKDDDFLIIEYGNYPQDAAPINIQKELNYYFENKMLTTTKKTYTVDNADKDSEFDFIKAEYFEYEYNGKYYVRATSNPYYNNRATILSNGIGTKPGDIIWIEVKPIIWTKHIDDDVMISDKCLFANIKYSIDKKYSGNYESSFLNKYIDSQFSKDIQKIK